MASDTQYDVIVAGLGAMGSSAVYHLTSRGKRVLGLDRFHPPHTFGSSHGRTRIIREAYFEHPLYVPLVQRAYKLWGALEQACGQQVLLSTGGLMIGRPDSALVTGAKRSAHEHRLPHEILSATEIQARFPLLHPEPDMIAVWEPRAGILFPERAIQSHLDLAQKQGAQLLFDEPALEWKPVDRGVAVQTRNGSYRAKRLLLTVGAWLSSLVPELDLPLTIERQVLFWFEPRSDREQFSCEKCPIHLWQSGPHHFFYGFPDLGDGVKAAVHHQGDIVQADTVRRDVSDDEKAEMLSLLGQFLPAAAGHLKSSEVCLYTNTPDEHFILDYHPRHHEVVVASPCSGHGFKFSSVIGELAADMLEDIQPKFDLSLFRINRFAPGL